MILAQMTAMTTPNTKAVRLQTRYRCAVREDRQDRWQTFAKAMALALGINLWIALVLAAHLQPPQLWYPTVDGLKLPGSAVLFAPGSLPLWLILSPLSVLLVGILRRSEPTLLLAYPIALLVPISLAPAMVSESIYGPVRTTLVAISLVAYLAGASTLTSFRIAPLPKSSRPLRSALAPMAPRWRRRGRIYATFAIAGLAFPLALLYHANFNISGAAALRENYGNRSTNITTLLNLGLIGGWLLLFRVFFLAPLEVHRRGDRHLPREISRAIRRSKEKSRLLLLKLAALLVLVLGALWSLSTQ